MGVLSWCTTVPVTLPASALIVSPTHQEAALVTEAVRAGLRATGKLREERSFAVWVPAHLSEAERGRLIGRKAEHRDAIDEVYGSMQMDEPVDEYIERVRGR